MSIPPNVHTAYTAHTLRLPMPYCSYIDLTSHLAADRDPGPFYVHDHITAHGRDYGHIAAGHKAQALQELADLFLPADLFDLVGLSGSRHR